VNERSENRHFQRPHSHLTPPPQRTPANICTNLPETTFLGLHFCRWQYMGSSANFRTILSEIRKRQRTIITWMFYGTTCWEKFLTVAGEKAQCNYCFIATFFRVIYYWPTNNILFYKRIFRSDNVVLRVLSSLKCNAVCAILSKCNIPGVNVTERALWTHFVDKYI